MMQFHCNSSHLFAISSVATREIWVSEMPIFKKYLVFEKLLKNRKSNWKIVTLDGPLVLVKNISLLTQTLTTVITDCVTA